MCARMPVIAFAVLLAACGGSGSGGQASGDSLTVVQLNTLHGLVGAGCVQADNCRLADRLDLLFRWIARSGCPDVVALQEVSRVSAPLIMDRLAGGCRFTYQAMLGPQPVGIDDQMILSRYPILAMGRQALFPGFRYVSWARIDHPRGPLDVFVTHLASTSDSAESPCLPPLCPTECADTAQTVRDCQAVEMASFIEHTHDVDTPAVIAGDFNSHPGSFVYDTFTSRGWSDTYLAAGNPDCDPASGAGCTSGREDESLVDLESSTNNETERIDFIFLIPPRDDSTCRIDRSKTRLFADRPNPFAPTCGLAPAAICWPSDHEGNQLAARCG